MFKPTIHYLTKQNVIRNSFLILLMAFLIAGCKGQQIVPFEQADPRYQLAVLGV